MTRALVVHHLPAVGSDEVVALRTLGYLVEQCRGPAACDCPVVHGRSCPLVERADVLVYDVVGLRLERDGRELGAELRALYADKPLVVVAGGAEPGALEAIEPSDGVVWLRGVPEAERLSLGIEEALGDR